jgi:hypothetical protein
MALELFVGPCPLQFRNLYYTVRRTPWTGDQPIARPLPTHRTTQTRNKRMPRLRFELASTVFEWAKTFHALDRSDTVIGDCLNMDPYYAVGSCFYLVNTPLDNINRSIRKVLMLQVVING